MENLNILEILKLGLPGLVFLLSMLSYSLLSKEQKKEQPSSGVLKSIRNFMYINVLLAILTLAAPIIDHILFAPSQVFSIEAKASASSIERGKVAVCQNAAYANRYLLVRDNSTGYLIQVFAGALTPCSEGSYIVLNADDASNLGWDTRKSSSMVDVVSAPEGYKFTI